jgi:hypothetical protein
MRLASGLPNTRSTLVLFLSSERLWLPASRRAKRSESLIGSTLAHARACQIAADADSVCTAGISSGINPKWRHQA